MGIFDRYGKKERKPVSEYEQVSALGDDPKAWEELGNEQFKQLVIVKCIEYGVSQDASRIPLLFALYRHAMQRLDVSERMQLLNNFSGDRTAKRKRAHGPDDVSHRRE
jgi:hypothetical protein